MIARTAAVAVLFGFRPRRVTRVAVRGWAAPLAGLADAVADVAFVVAATRGELSLTAMLAGLYPVVTVVLALSVLRERCGRCQRAGLVLAPLALVLMAT